MGKPVSIEMDSVEFIRRGFPSELDYLVSARDIDLATWKGLIEDELLRLGPVFRELHGFLSYQDLLRKLEARLGPIRSVGGLAHEGGRLMVSVNGSHFVLTRGCTWLECWMPEGVNSGDLKIDDYDGDALLPLLEHHGYRLGHLLLQSLTSMFNDSISDKQARLDKLIEFRATSNFGRSLNRIGGWRNLA